MPTSVFLDYSTLWIIESIVAVALVSVWPVKKIIKLGNRS